MKNNKKITDPRHLVAQALVRVEQDGSFSNIVLDSLLQTAALAPSDRKLATRLFYATLTHLRTLDYFIAKVKPDYLTSLDPFMRAIFRSASCQMRFFDRIPDYSVLNQSVGIIKSLRGPKAAGFCNAILRKIALIVHEPIEEQSSFQDQLAIEYSLSDDLAKRIIAQFGEENAKKLADTFNKVAPTSVRVNQSKISVQVLQEALHASTSLLAPTALRLNGWSVDLTKAIQAGNCTVQDEASQIPILALGDLTKLPHEEGKPLIIWDACAGQGGKTIHLLDRLVAENIDAKVLATDLYQSKLERILDYQLRYFQTQKLYTRSIDLQKAGSVSMAPFSAILVDAPCSGLGVLRRHPEGKWNKLEADLAALPQIQATILDHCAPHVRPNGILIYAVCTFTPEETTEQVTRFLEKHSNFVQESLPLPQELYPTPTMSLQLLPHIHDCDGFFIARFRRLEKSEKYQ